MRALLYSILSICPVLALATNVMSNEKIVTQMGDFPVVEEKSTSESRQYGFAAKKITQKDLELKAKEDLSSSLKGIKGLTVNQTGGGGSPTLLQFRGMRHRHTSVFLDGTPINDASVLDNASWIDSIFVDDLDEIELVYGPHSIKSPDPTPGGSIFIKTKTPQLGHHLKAKESFGSYGKAHFGSDLSYADDKKFVSFGGIKHHNKGHDKYWDSFHTLNKQDYDNKTVHGKFGLHPSDRFEIATSGRFIKADQNLKNKSGFFYDHIDQKMTHSRSFARLFLLEDQKWEHQVDLHYLKHERDYKSLEKEKGIFNSQKIVASYETIYNFDMDNKIKLGGEKIFEEAQFAPTSQKEQKREGGYTQILLAPLKNFKTSLGLRYYGKNKEKWAYSFGSSWRTIEELEFHGNYGKSFKIPSFYQLYAPIYGNPILEPEVNHGGDVGFDLYLLNNKICISALVFANRVRNPINFNFETWHYDQKTKFRTKGIESEIEVKPFDKLKLYGNYTYTKVTEEKHQLKGQSIPLHQYKLGAEKKIGEKVTVLFEGRYRNSIISGPEKLKPVFILDQVFHYHLSENVRFFNRFDNLTNQRYLEVFDFPAPRLTWSLGFSVSL